MIHVFLCKIGAGVRSLSSWHLDYIINLRPCQPCASDNIIHIVRQRTVCTPRVVSAAGEDVFDVDRRLVSRVDRKYRTEDVQPVLQRPRLLGGNGPLSVSKNPPVKALTML